MKLSYLQGQATDDPAVALQMLLEQNVVPNLPPAAKAQPGAFREAHLYSEDVDAVLTDYKPLLTALYSCYRMRPPGGGLRLKVRIPAPVTSNIHPAFRPKSPGPSSHYYLLWKLRSTWLWELSVWNRQVVARHLTL